MLTYSYEFDPSIELDDPFSTFDQIYENTNHGFRQQCQQAYTFFGTSVQDQKIEGFISDNILSECIRKFRFGDQSWKREKYTGYFFTDVGYIQMLNVYFNKEEAFKDMRYMHERVLFIRNNKSGEIIHI